MITVLVLPEISGLFYLFAFKFSFSLIKMHIGIVDRIRYFYGGPGLNGVHYGSLYLFLHLQVIDLKELLRKLFHLFAEKRVESKFLCFQSVCTVTNFVMSCFWFFPSFQINGRLLVIFWKDRIIRLRHFWFIQSAKR